MDDRTKTDIVKCLFGHKLLLQQDRYVLQLMEVLPIVDLSTVVIGTGSWIVPIGRKIPRKRGRSKEELVLPSMNGR